MYVTFKKWEQNVIEIIQEAAVTGKIGDGKIFRLRSPERHAFRDLRDRLLCLKLWWLQVFYYF
ncbi:MAG: P-II family nitrogen regulator [Deltaproteobacteria bacterium]|jgi:hypothetical protein|nr:P-II family nitrogen regulator [Deltaproteobacteria bacterium]